MQDRGRWIGILQEKLVNYSFILAYNIFQVDLIFKKEITDFLELDCVNNY